MPMVGLWTNQLNLSFNKTMICTLFDKINKTHYSIFWEHRKCVLPSSHKIFEWNNFVLHVFSD